MASFAFTTTENPLSSPWSTATGGGALRATGGECANAAGSDGDSAARYSSSSATRSIVEYRSGTFDGGPCFFDSSGNGYVPTCYSGTTVELYRMDGGFPNYSRLGGDAAVSFSAGDVAELALVGNDVVFYKNSVEIFRQTDSTYRTGLSPGIFQYAGNLRTDNWTDGASGTSYTLSCAQGSYSLTGQATALRAARRITAAQVSYALNGQSVALRMARNSLSANTGSYSLNGQSVSLIGPIVGYSMAMGQGSYALTGSDAAVDIVIAIGSGSYSLTGNPVALRAGRKTAIAQASYALNGQALSFGLARTISIAQGYYSLTGNDVGLAQHAPAPRLVAQTGFYSLNGNAINLFGPGDSNLYFMHRPFDPFGWYRQ